MKSLRTITRNWLKYSNFYQSNLKKIFTIPALIGKLLNDPLYYRVQKIIVKKALYCGHYGSIMDLVSLSFTPFIFYFGHYLFINFTKVYLRLVFILTPFFAWCFIRTKPASIKILFIFQTIHITIIIASKYMVKKQLVNESAKW